MIFIILSVFLFFVTSLLAFFCYNLYNQTIQLEALLKKSIKKETDIDAFYKYILGLLTHAYAEIQRVDKRGTFAGDDEVGFIFRVFYRAIEDTKIKLESIRKTDESI